MNCTEVMELLSDYYDGELEPTRRTSIEDHLAACIDCARRLEGFKQLSHFVHKQPSGSPAPDWMQLDAALNSVKESPESDPVKPTNEWAIRSPYVWWIGMAASILLVFAGAWTFFPKQSGTSEQHQFTAEFGRYLDEFQRDPDSAQEMLLQLYDHERIAAGEVSVRLGYSPATSEGLPDGYTSVSTQVLDMPCCTCVQTICERSDGTKIALFEHGDDGSKEWFGDRPASMESCNNKECQLVNLNERYAATWKRGSRYITLIGVRDMSEIDTFVTWLDQQELLDEG